MKFDNDIIGLFPLRLFLLNKEQTTLHITEPKYLQLINDCLYKKAYFGIPFQSKTKLHEYGCVVKIVEVSKKYRNGNLDVLVECVNNFKLNSFVAKKENCLYPGGELKIITDEKILPNKELIKLASSYSQLLFEDTKNTQPTYLDINYIISLLSLEDEEKLRLFKYNSLKKMKFLIYKIKYMSILVHKEKLVEHQYHLN